jgi:hypothetical protein
MRVLEFVHEKMMHSHNNSNGGGGGEWVRKEDAEVQAEKEKEQLREKEVQLLYTKVWDRERILRCITRATQLPTSSEVCFGPYGCVFCILFQRMDNG